MIYFILGGDLVKIGSTNSNVHHRVKNLMCGSPIELDLIACVSGTIAEEHALHKQFSEYRARGEWFRYEGELRVWISDLVKAMSSEDLRSLEDERAALIAELALIDQRIDKISKASKAGHICASDLGSRGETYCERQYVNIDYLEKGE